jgi:mono/diheme cytochrome c family protein
MRRDMVNQPSYRPQEDPRPLPDGAVARGAAEAPMTREQAIATLRNPVAATKASLERGRRLYAISCGHCHGAGAKGDGPVAAKFVKPADLTSPQYAKAADGLLYYAIRYGTPMMPPHSEALAPEERWDVVNHLRRLQRP